MERKLNPLPRRPDSDQSGRNDPPGSSTDPDFPRPREEGVEAARSVLEKPRLSNSRHCGGMSSRIRC